MARPERHDADYFPFICKDGRTLFILEGKYQCKGTGFFTNVMRFLTMEKDHHVCLWKDTDRLFFFSRAKCDEESAMDMLNLMAMTGKIDRDLWEKHRVVFYQDLLDSLKDAYRQRRNQMITIEQVRSLFGAFGAELSTAKIDNTVNHAGNDISSGRNTPPAVLTAGFNHKGKERKGKDIYSADFETFYTAYPKKKAPDKAWEAWKKRNGNMPSVKILLEAIEDQKKSPDWLKDGGQFIPHPATWLNQGRWADEVETPKPKGSW
jgi:hypothetical protein